LFCAVLLSAGCATPPQTGALLARVPQSLPQRVELADVPFYPQERYQCGPAALATALVHSGVQVTPEDLVEQVYLPAREGSLQAEMLATGRRHGRVAHRLEPRLEHVLREVAAGNPVIALQNLAFGFAPLWHYAVVVGYDLTRGELVLRSGTTRRLVMGLDAFERTWARASYWAMVTLAPERLPAVAVEDRYLASVAARPAAPMRPRSNAGRPACLRASARAMSPMVCATSREPKPPIAGPCAIIPRQPTPGTTSPGRSMISAGARRR
jgi:hypothetical protein